MTSRHLTLAIWGALLTLAQVATALPYSGSFNDPSPGLPGFAIAIIVIFAVIATMVIIGMFIRCARSGTNAVALHNRPVAPVFAPPAYPAAVHHNRDSDKVTDLHNSVFGHHHMHMGHHNHHNHHMHHHHHDAHHSAHHTAIHHHHSHF